MMGAAHLKIERIVQQIRNGRLVPFLGAGVSLDAKHDDGKWDGHHTDSMRASLREALSSHWAFPPEAIRLLGLAELCELYLSLGNDPLARTNLLVRDTLQIHKFQGLIPTDAHRYIAFLAKEGLIKEAFTTNYDTALERAIVEANGHSFSPRGCRRAKGHPGKDDPEVSCACCADSYRSDFPGCNGSRRLRLYKINGCARGLSNPDDKSAAARILLTERQLQAFRQRRWAEDLFRDRLRSRSILFCGFGSPEPQIRHTVGQVLEEFESDEATVSATELAKVTVSLEEGEAQRAPLLDHEDCPFVAAFEKDLAFHQWQIATAFALAHRAPPSDAHLLLIRPADGRELGIVSDDKLPANVLWREIFERVVAKLILDELRPGESRLARELRIACRGGDLLVAELIQALQRGKQWFGWLMAWDCSSGNRALRVSSLISWLTTGKPPVTPGYYASLREHAPLLLKTVLLMLALPQHDAAILERACSLGLLLTTGRGHSLAVTATGAMWGARPDERSGSGKVMAAIALSDDDTREAFYRVRLAPSPSGSPPTFAPVRVAGLILDKVLSRHKEEIGSLDDLRALLEQVAEEPTNELRAAQASVKRRPKLIPLRASP